MIRIYCELKKSPQKLYSAAGEGYFESQDYGVTWEKMVD